MAKNIVTISLSVFIVAVIIILGGAVFFNQNNATPAPVAANNNNINSNTNSDDASDIRFTQVAEHRTPSDCWVIVAGKVYNVTALLPIHKAGADKITPFCGNDATTAFETRGTFGPHPQTAQDALKTYLVGNLSQD